MAENNISPEFLKRRLAEITSDPDVRAGSPEFDNRGGGDHFNGMDTWQVSVETRVSELKEAVNGLRHSQNLTIAAVGLVLAVTLAGFAYLAQKVDNLPNEFHAIAQSITQAVTATRAGDQRQPAPIIIQVPTSAPSPAPERTTPAPESKQ